MRKKLRGRKYRNLHAKGNAIIFEKVIRGQRVRRSCRTDDWDVAAEVREHYERDLKTRPFLPSQVPTFSEMTARYLEALPGYGLKETTQEDRRQLLKDAGPILPTLGRMRLDQIGKRELLDWWQRVVVGRKRSVATGRKYLDSVSCVFGLAVDADLIDANPADAFRAILRRRSRTARGRAEADASAKIHPIEKGEHVAGLVEASAKVGGKAHMLDLLLLDAGLRLGEGLALRWDDVWFGVDADDTRRHLRVRASLSRGKHLGTTKSGRERKVAMSRRLRSALLAHPDAAGTAREGTGSGAGWGELPEPPLRGHLQGGPDRALHPKGSAGYLGVPAHHGGRAAWLRERSARPRRHSGHSAPLRAVGGRGLLPRADAARSGRDSCRPAGSVGKVPPKFPPRGERLVVAQFAGGESSSNSAQ